MSAVMNVCPAEGCRCEFKGFKTLYNHYSRKHCDNDTVAMKLHDAWARQPARKASVKVEAVQSTIDLTFDEMKWGLLQLINEATPCRRVSPDPSSLPIPSFVSAVQFSEDLIPTDLLTESEPELNIEAEIESETETEPETEPFATKSDTSCDYDAYLIECCRTIHDGGFVKAYRMLKRGDASYAVNPKYDLTDTKDHLELVFNALCDAWFDYTRSDDYDDAHDGMFDDQADWLDVCGLLITNENKKEFH